MQDTVAYFRPGSLLILLEFDMKRVIESDTSGSGTELETSLHRLAAALIDMRRVQLAMSGARNVLGNHIGTTIKTMSSMYIDTYAREDLAHHPGGSSKTWDNVLFSMCCMFTGSVDSVDS